MLFGGPQMVAAVANTGPARVPIALSRPHANRTITVAAPFDRESEGERNEKTGKLPETDATSRMD